MTRPSLHIASLAAVALSACHGEATRHAAAEATRVEVVRRGKVVDRVLLAGELHATAAVELTVPHVKAWVAIRWLAEDGAHVKTGDRVVELDNTQFSQQLDDKRLLLTTAELTLASARALSVADTATKELELQQHKIELAKCEIQAAVPAELLGGRDAQDRQLKLAESRVAVDKAAQDLAS
jgi:multidrug efflux pump subunit AcrA (membrane-fusion protein)